MRSPKQTRRSLFFATLGAFLTARRFAAAQEDQPGSSDRPRKGDLLVVSEGDLWSQKVTAPAPSSCPMT